jgi:hypothetical protein
MSYEVLSTAGRVGTGYALEITSLGRRCEMKSSSSIVRSTLHNDTSTKFFPSQELV